MAAICVHSYPPSVECNARALLSQASAALEKNAFVECGCYLREALREYLRAECQYHDCLPREKPGVCAAPPRVLALRLKRKKILSPELFEWIVEIIEAANKAVHLCFVPPCQLETGIGLLQSFLNGSPYFVQPSPAARRMS